ncbi:MAG: TonB-dependent receptor [Sulfuritalea sp.]|nr:TonB-dependent receptor [Sulfuritalea sp.]
MYVKLKSAAMAAAAFSILPVHAEKPDDAAVVVTATRVSHRETEATHAAEVHSRRMIENSGATTLLDYLGQHSSLTVMPNYGNRFTPVIEMRGYGLEAGNQNVVVSIDGQRLNNIDLQPQLLGAIPLSAVDRIEIAKGTGSVMQGDGAMAGAINITTRHHDGVSFGISTGSHGALAASATAGMSGDTLSLTVSADNDRHGGFSAPDSSGKKDASSLRAERARLTATPTHDLTLRLDLSSAHVDTRYANALTLAQFNANPAQNGGANIFTNYVSDVDRWRAGMEYRISDTLKLTADHHRLDQQNASTAWWGSFKAGYDAEGNDVALIYTGPSLSLTVGWQQADASRTQTTNRTAKDNSGQYFQGAYRHGNTTFSLGGRHEKVDYSYTPTAGARTTGNHRLSAWDAGINHRLTEKYTVFGNVNASFQAPDVDRFFNAGGAFNGLIAPARAKTLTVGIHRDAGRDNRFKLALFRANLTNEIYYDPIGFNNTNIDKSHKQGIEVHQYWKATADVSINANYAWTKAVIDRENSAAGAYAGKEMPGVPRHSLNLAATYAINASSDATLTHSWRAKSYAIGDFDNNNAQRQAAFEATNLSFRHKRNSMDYFVTFNNIFNRVNGVWTGDNSIYPMNFSRSLIAGINVRI